MSQLIACHTCDGAVSKMALYCPHCGAPIFFRNLMSAKIGPLMTTYLLIGIAVTVFLFFAYVKYSRLEAKENMIRKIKIDNLTWHN